MRITMRMTTRITIFWPSKTFKIKNRKVQRKWLSMKNRSTRCSTTRHLITMVSTAKHPDPMPCALAAILLPESCAHGCLMQKTLFPGTYWVHKRTGVIGPFLHAGCAGAAWVRGGSLGCGMGAGGRCLAPRVGGVRWSGSPLQRSGRLGTVCGRARAGLGDVVSSHGAASGMRGRLG
jgi:hypothetical protein